MNKEKFFPQNDVYMRAGQSKMKAVSSEHPEEAGE